MFVLPLPSLVLPPHPIRRYIAQAPPLVLHSGATCQPLVSASLLSLIVVLKLDNKVFFREGKEVLEAVWLETRLFSQ